MEGTDQCTIATISEWSDHQSRRREEEEEEKQEKEKEEVILAMCM